MPCQGKIPENIACSQSFGEQMLNTLANCANVHSLYRSFQWIRKFHAHSSPIPQPYNLLIARNQGNIANRAS
jgi:hypothetical protein